MNLIDKIFENKYNHSLLLFLKIKKEESTYFKWGKEAGSPFDDGSQTFFSKYGKDLPENTKVTLGIRNLLVNPESGFIFAFQWGRFTFVLRCDFSKTDISNTDKCRQANTADAEVDFTILGENWCIVNEDFEGEEDIHFKNSYELSKNYK